MNIVKIKITQYQKSLIKDALGQNGVFVTFDESMNEGTFDIESYVGENGKLAYSLFLKSFQDEVFTISFEALRDIINVYIRQSQSWEDGGFIILQNRLTGFDRLIVYYTKDPENFKSNALEFLSLEVEVIGDKDNTINLLSDNPVQFEPRL